MDGDDLFARFIDLSSVDQCLNKAQHFVEILAMLSRSSGNLEVYSFNIHTNKANIYNIPNSLILIFLRHSRSLILLQLQCQKEHIMSVFESRSRV